MSHPDLETLAELAEGTLGRAAAQTLRGHLATCRTCTAAYVDAVRYRAAWLARPELFVRAPEAARRVVALRRTRRGMAAWRRVRPAAAAAIVVALTIGAVQVERARRAPTLRLTLPPAVLAASERSSSFGLVLPGAAQRADRPAPLYRAGFAAPGAELDREVDALIVRYERGDRSPATAARLIEALLGIDDLDAARAYAGEALGRTPDDPSLLTCAAAAQYRSNDLAAAEGLLRTALSRAPGDPMVALDLGLVLRARGLSQPSAALLTRAAHGGSAPIAARARHELADAH